MPKTSTFNIDTLRSRIEEFCITNALIEHGDRIIIGLSGGPDSVLLTYILAELRSKHQLTLFAAHLDHGWRHESAQDAAFCRQLCASLSIPLEIEQAQNISLKKSIRGSKENLGRQLRRTFFAQLQKKYDANKIALAHHADDQIETFLIRLIRGATVTGLAAMRPHHGSYIRPLLTTPKKDILDWLDTNNRPYCIDPTNTSSDYLRNRIRNTLIPAFEAVDSRSTLSITKAIKHLQETDALLDEVVKSTYAEIAQPTHALDYVKLLALPNRHLQRNLVLHWVIASKLPFEPSKHILEEILRFFSNSKNTRHTIVPYWSIVKDRQYARLIFNKE